MKRSEMIEILWQAIADNLEAPELLAVIEQAGMLPPRYDWTWNGIRQSDYTWEPEPEDTEESK
jgi:hypothetical protein